MKSEFAPGTFLFVEDTQEVFLHDGTKNADGYGVAIGFSNGKFCRSSGEGSFQKYCNPRLATLDEIILFFINPIRNIVNIPFYSCI